MAETAASLGSNESSTSLPSVRPHFDLEAIASFDKNSLANVQTNQNCYPDVGTDPLKPILEQAVAARAARVADAAFLDIPRAASAILRASKDEMHGRLGSADWAPPELAAWANVEARPGYDSKMAHEYVDRDDVLQEKVKLLARLIQKSRKCIAYTGAGISTASGIGDYATRASNSLAGDQGAPKMLSPLEAQPTLSHCVLTSMQASGHLVRWVQQNHDGLPQKAGCPQSAINEIHGAWFDPSNPVVKMSGDLRSDLFADLLHWEQEADLVLALGTSLAGMNADRVVSSCAKRAKELKSDVLGSVIISLQQTSMDAEASVRIFAKIDDVMRLLAAELGLQPAVPPNFSDRQTEQFFIPYGSDGKRLPVGAAPRLLDLREGARVRITDGQFQGDVGEVIRRTRHGHFSIRFMHTVKGKWMAPMMHTLGQWWLQEAEAGVLHHFPIEGITPEEVNALDSEAKQAEQEDAITQREASAGGLPDWVKQAYREQKDHADKVKPNDDVSQNAK